MAEPFDRTYFLKSTVTVLSERSVAERSRPQDFPDFTRGAWARRPPLPIVTI